MPTVIDFKVQKPWGMNSNDIPWFPLVFSSIPLYIPQKPNGWKLKKAPSLKGKGPKHLYKVAIFRILYSIFKGVYLLLLVDPLEYRMWPTVSRFHRDVFFLERVGKCSTLWDSGSDSLGICRKSSEDWWWLDLYNWWAGPQMAACRIFSRSLREKSVQMLQNAQVFIVKHDNMWGRKWVVKPAEFF